LGAVIYGGLKELLSITAKERKQDRTCSEPVAADGSKISLYRASTSARCENVKIL